MLVEERIPGEAAVGGFPDATADCAEIVGVGLAGDARDCDGTAATEWADEAPFHAAVRFGIDRIGDRRAVNLLRSKYETNGENENAGKEEIFDRLAKRFHTNLR